MAIQPIDLQTLFTQLDKVAKTQSAQREGLALQEAIQGAQLQRKTEEHIQSVNEAQNTGDGTEKVKDKPPEGKEKKKDTSQKDHDPDNPEKAKTKAIVFCDPSLGKNIDISL